VQAPGEGRINLWEVRLFIGLTRRVGLALFMVEGPENDGLSHEVPTIVGRQTPSALAHAASGRRQGVHDRVLRVYMAPTSKRVTS
jgi:hypothetical protein